ncbi:MAG TPA: rhodanese-like domain-containing protein [Myxococcales bacterium]|nr:rhodanese-like domain-containing protein [Myxococcales bacterium]
MSSLEIGPEDLAKALAPGAKNKFFLLDVRNGWEHELARLPDDALIPLPELPERMSELPKGAQIVAYCHHGVRSLSAAAILRDAGFDARSLAGGIDLWSRLIDPSVLRY